MKTSKPTETDKQIASLACAIASELRLDGWTDGSYSLREEDREQLAHRLGRPNNGFLAPQFRELEARIQWEIVHGEAPVPATGQTVRKVAGQWETVDTQGITGPALEQASNR